MPMPTAIFVMYAGEFVLWTALGFLFWKKALHRRFRAMGGYLILRATSVPGLFFLGYGQSRRWIGNSFFDVCFIARCAVYVAGAVLFYLICVEVFRSALSAFSGLTRFGLVIFRWAAFVSMIVGLSTISFAHSGTSAIADIAGGTMRSGSVVELCLLGFLCLSLNALHLPVRGLAFGISLGLGLIAVSDLVVVSLVSRAATHTAPPRFVAESLILVAQGIWIAWFAHPEAVRKPVVMPASSTIHRWNEIAYALGHTGTKVAVQPSNGFFLSDVEMVVEKVLTRNLKNRESET